MSSKCRRELDCQKTIKISVPNQKQEEGARTKQSTLHETKPPILKTG